MTVTPISTTKIVSLGPTVVKTGLSVVDDETTQDILIDGGGVTHTIDGVSIDMSFDQVVTKEVTEFFQVQIVNDTYKTNGYRCIYGNDRRNLKLVYDESSFASAIVHATEAGNPVYSLGSNPYRQPALVPLSAGSVVASFDSLTATVSGSGSETGTRLNFEFDLPAMDLTAVTATVSSVTTDGVTTEVIIRASDDGIYPVSCDGTASVYQVHQQLNTLSIPKQCSRVCFGHTGHVRDCLVPLNNRPNLRQPMLVITEHEVSTLGIIGISMFFGFILIILEMASHMYVKQLPVKKCEKAVYWLTVIYLALKKLIRTVLWPKLKGCCCKKAKPSEN